MVNGPGVPAQKPVEMAFRLEPGISHSLTRMEVVNAQGQTPQPDSATSESAGTLVSRKEVIIEETAKYSKKLVDYFCMGDLHEAKELLMTAYNYSGPHNRELIKYVMEIFSPLQMGSALWIVVTESWITCITCIPTQQ